MCFSSVLRTDTISSLQVPKDAAGRSTKRGRNQQSRATSYENTDTPGMYSIMWGQLPQHVRPVHLMREVVERTMTNPIPIAVNSGSPRQPKGTTHPFPLAITHALSMPFGITYMANSSRRRFSSTNSDSPESKPPRKKDCFEMRSSIQAGGSRFASQASKDFEPELRRDISLSYRLCLEQKYTVVYD